MLVLASTPENSKIQLPEAFSTARPVAATTYGGPGPRLSLLRMSSVLKKLKAAAESRWRETLAHVPDHAPKSETPPVQLVPVASGKGGVGKTNIAVALSILASQKLRVSGKKVLLIDGDLGLPNADLILGVRPDRSLADFADHAIADVSRLVSPTRYPGLDFIAGAEEATLALGNLFYDDRRDLIDGIARMTASLVIFDLGASASDEILDFFAMSPSGIIVLNPEPTSIRDAYVFLKNALIRRVRQELEHDQEAEAEFSELLKSSGGNWRALRERVLAGNHPRLGASWAAATDIFRPLLIVNRAESFSEGLDTARKFTRDLAELLGVHALYLGTVLFDPAVPRAVKGRRSVVLSEPHSPAAKCLEAITQKLLEHDGIDLNRNFASFGRILTARLIGRPT